MVSCWRLASWSDIIDIYLYYLVDFADQLVEELLIQYEKVYNIDAADVPVKTEDSDSKNDTGVTELWGSTHLVHLFTFLISVYKQVLNYTNFNYIPIFNNVHVSRNAKSKSIQCRNLFDSIQLHAILECFLSSCVSDYDMISRLFCKWTIDISDIP